MKLPRTAGLCFVLAAALAGSGGARAALAPDPAAAPALSWLTQYDEAAAAAQREGRPLLLLFETEGCVWCAKLKSETLTDARVRERLAGVVTARVDARLDRAAAARFRVVGVPKTVLVGADGQALAALEGFLSAPEFLRWLEQAFDPNAGAAEWRALLGTLQENRLPEGGWDAVLAAHAAADPRQRGELRRALGAMEKLPKGELVARLRDPRLAVRLGALDLLEDAAGDTFGFNPWVPGEELPAAGGENTAALATWDLWVADPARVRPRSDTGGDPARDHAQWAADLAGDEPERQMRAARRLAEAGAAALPALQQWLVSHPAAGAGARQRMKAAFYAALLAEEPAADPAQVAALAQQVAAGPLDQRLQGIAQLPAAGAVALPVLRDLLADPAPLVREATVSALGAYRAADTVTLLQAHFATETDANVVTAGLRALRRIERPEAAVALENYTGHEREEWAVVALDSLGQMRARPQQAVLVKALDDPRWRVRAAALEALGYLDWRAGDPAVAKKLLDDPDEFVRAVALKFIGARGASAELVKLYETQPEARGPVLAVFLEQEVPLPGPLREAVRSADADTLLQFLAAAADSYRPPLDLVEPLAQHANLDVACAALGLLAAKLGETSRLADPLAAALRGGVVEKQRAVLGGLQFSGTQQRAWSQAVARAAPSSVAPPPAPAGAAPADAGGSDAALDDLVNAFAGAVEASTPATPAALPPPAANGGDALEELTAAFGGPAAGAASASTSPPAGVLRGLDGLAFAVAECFRASPDEAVREAAATALLAGGAQDAVVYFMTQWAGADADGRSAILRALPQPPPDGAWVLLQRGVRDDAEPVRRTALYSLGRTSEGGAAAERQVTEVLAALDEPGAALTAAEVLDTLNLGSLADSLPRRSVEQWRDWSAAELAEAAGAHAGEPLNRAIFAALVLPKTGRTVTVPWDALLAHPHALVRRATWQAWFDAQPAVAMARADELAADPAAEVRVVLPEELFGDYGQRVYLLAGVSEERGRVLDFIDRENLRSTVGARVALMRMLDDPQPDIRARAALALLWQGQEVDPAKVRAALAPARDNEELRSAINQLLINQVRSPKARLDGRFAFLLNYGEREMIGAEWDRLERQLRPPPAGAGAAVMASAVPAPTPDEPARGAAPAAAPVARVAFFFNPGCHECEAVRVALDELAAAGGVEVRAYSLRDAEGVRYHEALAEKLGVPTGRRLIAPALFTSNGFAIKDELSPARLRELVRQAAAQPGDPAWDVVGAVEIAQAQASLEQTYAGLTLGAVLAAGLLDGVNPCAFATLIFFVSYLQIARRSPREVLAVGLSFVGAVFATYFVLGLGLVEVVARLTALRWAAFALHWALALALAVLVVLSVRDGVLGLRGRLADSSLQLPEFLKTRIRTQLRESSRSRRFVLAAAASGVVISVLELACTGQVYLPTIVLMLQDGHLGAAGWLLVYNAAFVVPLLVVFALVAGGLRSETLLRLQQRHGAAVKFALAALFAVMLGLLLYTGALAAPASATAALPAGEPPAAR